ncbi:nitrite reductase small subunit NirD [Vibrio mexicanus]|uniref:nitrite reductase small subunit NirD n=1 Tax=Vibrio mexicanus TaxID=1004326 RepID=UPI00063CBC7C|nr:nitrite reductase small subunit NirD [Vibrio mexicanus]
MSDWLTVCQKSDLVPQTGVCAFLNGHQIAIFNCQREGKLYAISNYDPIGKANVLSRGIIGSIDDEPYVASPLYEQHFHLETGACLEEQDIMLTTYCVRELDGNIQVQLPLSENIAA